MAVSDAEQGGEVSPGAAGPGEPGRGKEQQTHHEPEADAGVPAHPAGITTDYRTITRAGRYGSAPTTESNGNVRPRA